MRRLALLAVLGALAAGCGGESTVTPTAETVVGQPPPPPQPAAQGDPARGEELFQSKGCAGCHTFGPAGSSSQTGPNLDELQQQAERADQGLEDFVRESIVTPDAYVEEGFPEGVMPAWSGTDEELADLIAFLTQS